MKSRSEFVSLGDEIKTLKTVYTTTRVEKTDDGKTLIEVFGENGKRLTFLFKVSPTIYALEMRIYRAFK